MARFAVHQKVFEDLALIRDRTHIHQMAGKMGAADQASVGKGAGSFEGIGDTGLLQTSADLQGPLIAKRQ